MSGAEADLNLRVFNLVIGRVLKSAYLNLEEKDKKDMEQVFLSDDDKQKEQFIKKHMPNFKKLFEKEAKKIEGEIKSEIKNQF